MNLGTLPRFLVGDRKAIFDVAASKHGLWLGLLFVLSAGFAREYDGEDLLFEPWHLAIPLGASLGSSLVLFLLIELAAWFRGVEHGSILARYKAFLQVFWMTAPLAWLYAIPVERFLSPADAVRANLALLGLVAAWRVVLITRAISVIYQVRHFAPLAIVMLYSVTVTVVVVRLTPRPIFEIMGGIRHSEGELVIQTVAAFVLVLGILSWPIWLLTAIVAIFRQRWSFNLLIGGPCGTIHWSAWALGVISISAWALVLPYAQPEQQNRRQVDRLMRQGNIIAGVQFLTGRRREDFPPQWEPPPRIGYGERVPDVIQVIEVVLDEDAPLWVRQTFVDKLLFQMSGDEESYEVLFSPLLRVDQMNDDELRRATSTLGRFPEGAGIAAKRRKMAEQCLENKNGASLSPERRELIEEFLRLAARGKADELDE